MMSAWRVSHAGFCRRLEGSLGDELPAWVVPPDGVPCRNPTTWCVLSLNGGEEPAETGP
jgi:hypothetical protein